MKSVLLALSLALPTVGAAATLTYEIDLTKSQLEPTIAFDMCNLPKLIQLDSREDLATAVIERTNRKPLSVVTIQATKGSVSGGGLEEPYVGDYRTRVALIKLKGFESAYRLGVYWRFEMTSYGSTSAPKAFEVEMDLLNHRESAELAEDLACAKFAYKLK